MRADRVARPYPRLGRGALFVTILAVLASAAPRAFAAPSSRLGQAVKTATEALRTERYGDVVKALRPALAEPAARSDPRAGDAWRLLGHAHLRQGNLAGAREAFAHALATGALRPDALRGLARATARQDQPDAAISLLRLALALQSASAAQRTEIRLELADLLTATGDPAAAAATLAIAARERPANPRVAAAQGRHALEAGRPRDAALFLETAAALGDTRPALFRSLARLYRDLPDPVQQARWAERLLQQPAPLPEDHLLVAEARAALHSFPTALREARRAMEALPAGSDPGEVRRKARVARRVGHVRLASGDPAGAAAAWTTAAKAGDDDPELARFLGLRALRTKKRGESIRWLERWRASGGRDAETLRALAGAHLDEGRADAAREVLADYVAAHGVDHAIEPLLDRLAALPAEQPASPTRRP